MIEMCKRILRYLDKNSLSDIQDPKYDECTLLNYWVYSKLVNIFRSDNSSIIDNPFAALLRIWNEIIDKQPDKPFYKKCQPDSATIMKRDWRKIKELYDYYVNYDALFKTAKNFPDKCEEYYGKIKNMEEIFHYFENFCSNYPNACPKIYNECKPYNPESTLVQLPCHSRIIGKSGPILNDNSSHEVIGSIEMHPKSADDFVVDFKDVFTVESETQLYSENSGIGTKVTHSILGAAPVLLTGTMLYRYELVNIIIYMYYNNK
ncbi:hypothetical protein PCYB_006400 [Plasmodium cynomolgi strain B]|uniref:CYIR protein n=1 Tax=Plasmodium cynomolgi (strain B) TaxID=1120755 RepID=K6UFD1_PLACD|nr:hypothetical protein PCYB_006400 [Plasmodium cynomolgi strain B]GAB69891.1 hypothetical protein PCYB_006400 [Plasmodium cynomolgi strain B]